jgi:hypothetical protein
MATYGSASEFEAAMGANASTATFSRSRVEAIAVMALFAGLAAVLAWGFSTPPKSNASVHTAGSFKRGELIDAPVVPSATEAATPTARNAVGGIPAPSGSASHDTPHDPTTTATGDVAPNVQFAYDGAYLMIPWTTLCSWKHPFPGGSSSPSGVPDLVEPPTVPKQVQELNGKQVVVEGFVIPIDQGSDGVRSFLLCRAIFKFCCFADYPGMNEMMVVRCKTPIQLNVNQFIPLRVYGTISVGEEIDATETPSFYRMVADKVVESAAR